MVVPSNKGRGSPPLPLLIAALAAAIGITFVLAYAFHPSSPGDSDGGGDNNSSNDDDEVLVVGSGTHNGKDDNDYGDDARLWMRKDRSESDVTLRTANVTATGKGPSASESAALLQGTRPSSIAAESTAPADAMDPAGELTQNLSPSSPSTGVAVAALGAASAVDTPEEEVSATATATAKPTDEDTTAVGFAADSTLPQGMQRHDNLEPSVTHKKATKMEEKQGESKKSTTKKKEKEKEKIRPKLTPGKAATDQEGGGAGQGVEELGFGRILTTAAASATSTQQQEQDQGEGKLGFGDIATTAAAAAATTTAPSHLSTLHTSTTTASTATVSTQPTPNRQQGGGAAAASTLRPLRVENNGNEPEPPVDLAYNNLSSFWKKKEVRHSFVQPKEIKRVSYSGSSGSPNSNDDSVVGKEEADSGARKGGRGGGSSSTAAGQEEEGESVTSTKNRGPITKTTTANLQVDVVQTADEAKLGVDTVDNVKKDAEGENAKPKDGSVDDNDPQLILPSASDDSISRSNSISSKGSSGYVKIVRTPEGDVMTESEFLSRPLVVVDGGATSETTREGGGEVMFAPPPRDTAAVVDDAAAAAAAVGVLPTGDTDKREGGTSVLIADEEDNNNKDVSAGNTPEGIAMAVATNSAASDSAGVQEAAAVAPETTPVRRKKRQKARKNDSSEREEVGV